MKIMLFENFKKNNIEGNLIKLEDIIECIEKNGFIYASIVNNLKNHDSENKITPVSVDNDGLITVNIQNKLYTVDIKNVKKIKIKRDN